MIPGVPAWLPYRLSATDDRGTSTITLDVTLVSYEHERLLAVGFSPDALAVFEAIPEVMNRGHSRPRWAKGRIELRAPDGRVVEVMEAK